MILPKSCSRCLGDLTEDEVLGEVDPVCIQCGYLYPLTTRDTYVAQRKAIFGAKRNAAGDGIPPARAPLPASYSHGFDGRGATQRSRAPYAGSLRPREPLRPHAEVGPRRRCKMAKRTTKRPGTEREREEEALRNPWLEANNCTPRG